MQLLAALFMGLVCLLPAEPGTRRDHGQGSVSGPCINRRPRASIHASPSRAPLPPSQSGQLGEPAVDEEESDDTDPLVPLLLFAIGSEPTPAFVETAHPRRTPTFAPLERRPANLRC